MEVNDTIETATIVGEIARAKKILQAKPLVSDTKAELLDNLYPILELLAAGLGKRVDAVEGTVYEILSQSESLITAEHAEQIIQALQIGLGICALLGNPKLNKDGRLRKQLKRNVAAYLEVVPDTIKLIQEFTMEDDDEEDDDELAARRAAKKAADEEEPLIALDDDTDDPDDDGESDDAMDSIEDDEASDAQ